MIIELNTLFSILKSQAIEKEVTELNKNLVKEFDEEKQEFLALLFLQYRKRLEDTQKVSIANEVPILTGFNWRMEVELSGSDRTKTFVPNYLLNLKFSEIDKEDNLLA